MSWQPSMSRETAGIYCEKVLVCEYEPSDAIKNRAASDRVKLVYGPKIDQIATTLRAKRWTELFLRIVR